MGKKDYSIAKDANQFLEIIKNKKIPTNSEISGADSIQINGKVEGNVQVEGNISINVKIYNGR